MQRPFPWAIAGYGSVAAGGHHHGIQRIGHELVGFTTGDEKIQRGDARHVTFNWGTTGTKFDARAMKVSKSPDDSWLRSLRGKAEAVLVTVPTRFHHEVAERVLRAGFDCFIEKPFAETSTEAIRLRELAKKLERKLLVAHVLPAFNEFGYLRSMIIEKGIFQLQSLMLQRYVPWAEVSKGNPIAKNGGYYADLAVHDSHFVASLGSEAMVKSTQVRKAHGFIQHANVEIDLLGVASGAKIIIDAGATPKVEGFQHSFEAAWVDGDTLEFDKGRLLHNGAQVDLPKQEPADIFGLELALAADHFRTGADPGFLSSYAAYEALRLVEEVVLVTR